MDIAFSEPKLPASGTLVVTVLSGGELGATAKRVDKRLGGALSRAIAAGDFTGKKTEIVELLAPSGSKLDRVVAVGLGAPEKLGDLACSRAVWSRKGPAGRMLTVLTPFKDGIATPKIQLLEDTEQRTACSVVFDDHEDRITFLAPRPAIETDDSPRLKSGLRLRMTRVQRQQQYAQFLIPPNPGPYVLE